MVQIVRGQLLEVERVRARGSNLIVEIMREWGIEVEMVRLQKGWYHEMVLFGYHKRGHEYEVERVKVYSRANQRVIIWGGKGGTTKRTIPRDGPALLPYKNNTSTYNWYHQLLCYLIKEKTTNLSCGKLWCLSGTILWFCHLVPWPCTLAVSMHIFRGLILSLSLPINYHPLTSNLCPLFLYLPFYLKLSPSLADLWDRAKY